MVQRALREADHLRADADAAFVERLDGDLVALADLAEHVRSRHAAVLEDQLARAARTDAELVFLLADREAGRVALDQERRDALVAGAGIDVGEDDEEVGLVAVGDPELAAVEDVVVAVVRRRGWRARTRRCPSLPPTARRRRPCPVRGGAR